MTSQRKLDMVGTYLNVWKRAKRTSDIIVATTKWHKENPEQVNGDY